MQFQVVGTCCWSGCGRPTAVPAIRWFAAQQHHRQLALGFYGLGRLTRPRPAGWSSLNFDVGWGRLLGTGMGPDIAWLLPRRADLSRRGFVPDAEGTAH